MSLPSNYIQTIAQLKEQIRNARNLAAFKANTVLVQLYWDIGSAIVQMQTEAGWGAKVIDRIAADLKADFPDFKGLSVRKLKYMASFAKAFPYFGQQAAVQSKNVDNQRDIIGQQAAAQLPWGHIQLLLDKLTDKEALLFYATACIENGWSRNILVE